MNTAWQLAPSALLESDIALTAAVEDLYRSIYHDHFRDDLAVNHALPVETRAARRMGEWRLFLLLTPWMLSRLLVPGTSPEWPLPEGWSAADRKATPPVVLGPLLDFTLLDTPQRAHLNHHPLLGHYLIQPLVLAMEPYTTANEVYDAWNKVIRTRDENMRRMDRECSWQKEVSRREFFRGLWNRPD